MPHSLLRSMLLLILPLLALLPQTVAAQDGLHVEVVQMVPPACAREASGKVVVRASGGQAPYSFRLQGREELQNETQFIQLKGGAHRIFVFDAAGRATFVPFILPEPDSIAIEFATTSPSRCNAADGSIQITAIVNALAPLTLWLDDDDLGAQRQINNLFGGMYRLRVVDAAGCQRITHVDVRQPVALASEIDTLVVPTHCSSNNGYIKIATPQNGRAPYYFRRDFENWQSDSLFNNLGLGSYAVQIQDADECLWMQNVILDKARPNVVLKQLRTSQYCSDSITADLKFLTAPNSSDVVEYQLNLGAWVSDSTFLKVPKGTYTLRYRDTSDCYGIFRGNVASEVLFLAKTNTIKRPACSSDSSGVVAIAVLESPGYTAVPYEYSKDSIQWQSRAQFSRIPSGPFKFWVRNSKGCVKFFQVNIAGFDTLNLRAEAVLDSIPCGDKKTPIMIEGSGGTGPYQFSTDGENWSFFQPYDSLERGTYAAYIKDRRGCVVMMDSFKVAPAFELQNEIIQYPLCIDRRPNGAIRLITNESSGVRYSIDGGVSYNEESMFEGLAPGVYKTTAWHEGSNCVDSVWVDLSQIIVFQPELSIRDGLCLGQSASVKVSIVPEGYGVEHQLRPRNREEWNNEPQFDYFNLRPNLYSFHIRDSITKCAVFMLNEEPVDNAIWLQISSPLDYEFKTTKATNCTADDGSIRMISNLPGQYFMLRDNSGDRSQYKRLDYLKTGSYNLRVFNANGCWEDANVRVESESMLISFVANDATQISPPNGSCRISVGGTFVPPLTLRANNRTYASQDGIFQLDSLNWGTYHSNVIDSLGCEKKFAFGIRSPLSYFLKGKVYEDLNQNGRKEANEPGMPGMVVSYRYFIDSLGKNLVYTFSDSLGNYQLPAELGSFVVDVALRPHLELTQPVSGDHQLTVNSLSNLPMQLDFGIHKRIDVQDVSLSITQRNAAQPGQVVEYIVGMWNRGSMLPQPAAELRFDSLLTYVNMFGAQIQQQNNSSLSTKPKALEPKSYADPKDNYRIRFRLPEDPEITGQILETFANITNVPDDEIDINDEDNDVREITNAYDPNIKIVRFLNKEEADTAFENQTLEYIVYFQNTGNAPAINVRIEDEISSLLDLSTFESVAASHSYVVSMEGASPQLVPTRKQKVIWNFDNINLPDSTADPIASIGFVRFRVKPHINLRCDRHLTNSAAIFFDFNPPIITPDALTLLNPTPNGTLFSSKDTIWVGDTISIQLLNASYVESSSTWTFDQDANASNNSGYGPIQVIWSSPGDKKVRLGLFNAYCENTVETEIHVQWLCPSEKNLITNVPDSAFAGVDFAAEIQGIELTGTQFEWSSKDGLNVVGNVSTPNVARFMAQLPGNYVLSCKIEEHPTCIYTIERPVIVVACPDRISGAMPDTTLCAKDQWLISSQLLGSDLMFRTNTDSVSRFYLYKAPQKLLESASEPERNVRIPLQLLDTLTRCPYSAEAIVKLQACAVDIMSVFTPNGDGQNDRWMISTTDLVSLSVRVFDRYGVEVFRADQINESWDGSSLSGTAPAGTYLYFVEGTTRSGRKINRSGTLQLLR